MKQIVRSEYFLKVYRQRILPNKKLDKRFQERVVLFQRGKGADLLNDHALTRQMNGLRAFSVTGDVRVIYRVKADRYEFIDIGTHQEVYN